MAEITIVKPHDEGKSALEVTVNGEKWSLTRGETVDVPEYIATEVRRSLAQRDSLSLADRDEREGEPESGGSGGGGGESSNVETATIVITVTDSTPAITSGAFPDWCTAENKMNISGKMDLSNALVNGEAYFSAGIFKVIGVIERPKSFGSQEKYTIIRAVDGKNLAEICDISTDLVIKGQQGDWEITDGEIIINLNYSPEE